MEKKKADRTQGVNVADGIPRQPTGVFGRWIAEKEGDSPMGVFMNGDRKKKNRKLCDPICYVCEHAGAPGLSKSSEGTVINFVQIPQGSKWIYPSNRPQL
jgi:hypothetical protein